MGNFVHLQSLFKDGGCQFRFKSYVVDKLGGHRSFGDVLAALKKMLPERI